MRTSFSGMAYRGEHASSVSQSAALTSLSNTTRPAPTSAGRAVTASTYLLSEKPVPREGHPHAVCPIRLGFHTPHDAPHRHARSSFPREGVSREADDREQLRSDCDTPQQPHIETTSAEVVEHGLELELFPTRIHTVHQYGEGLVNPRMPSLFHRTVALYDIALPRSIESSHQRSLDRHAEWTISYTLQTPPDGPRCYRKSPVSTSMLCAFLRAGSGQSRRNFCAGCRHCTQREVQRMARAGLAAHAALALAGDLELPSRQPISGTGLQE